MERIVNFMRQRLAVALCLLAATGLASAETWPDKPIKLVVTTSPGSSSDILGRLLASKMSELLGQSVFVENRTGADGAIAMQYVAKSPADGYTLVFSTSGTMAVAPVLTKSLGYDPQKEFVPVSLVYTVPFVITVGKNSPAHSLQEFVAMVKAAPKTHSYGTGSPVTRLLMEAFNARMGTDLIGVSYKGPAEAATDVISGRVSALPDTVAGAAGQIAGGNLRALAVTSDARVPGLPDVPSMRELGFPELGLIGWGGIFAPAGTPAPVVARLGESLRQVLAQPEVAKAFAAYSSQPAWKSSADFGAMVASETRRLAAIAKSAGIEAQ